MKPVVAIYSTFLQRAYDQLVHDIALQNLPVLLAIDRAGLVGPDGPTHSGSFDISFLRCIPNMTIMTPTNEAECRQMLTTGFQLNGPAAVRYPRGKGPGIFPDSTLSTLPIGKGDVVRKGESLALLVFGSPMQDALKAAERLGASVANMRFAKPLDETLIVELTKQHQGFVTIEDGALAGGAGSAVNELLHQLNIKTPVLNIGLPDRFQEHSSREDLLTEAGLDAESIYQRICQYFKTENCNPPQPRIASGES
jgi:1-deoxy-D-xylulose-5-phosphate synthase